MEPPSLGDAATAAYGGDGAVAGFAPPTQGTNRGREMTQFPDETREGSARKKAAGQPDGDGAPSEPKPSAAEAERIV